MRSYWHISAILIAFWLGSELDADDGGVAKFSKIEADSIVLRATGKRDGQVLLLSGSEILMSTERGAAKSSSITVITSESIRVADAQQLMRISAAHAELAAKGRGSDEFVSRIRISAEPAGPHIEFRDRDGALRTKLGVLKRERIGEFGLAVLNSSGRTAVQLASGD